MTEEALSRSDAAALDDGMQRMLHRVRSNRWTIFALTVTGAVVLVLYGLVAEKWYEASTVLIEASDEAGNIGMASLLSNSGLGSLVGLQGQDAGTKAEALAVLKSSSFLREFIRERQLLPILFPDRFDSEHGVWEDDSEPSPNDGVRILRKKVLRISEDRSTGIVTLAVKWTSPELAADWANDLVARLNARMRADAIQQGQDSLAYLEQESERASNAELRKAIFELMQSQINRIMFASVRQDYAFKVLDVGLPPDEDDPIWPNFPTLAILGFLLGLSAGLLTAAIRKPAR